MPSLNKVILIGRLTRDPELRYTSSGLAVTSFTIAVDRRFKDQQTGERKTDFFRCTAWRQKAEFVQQYVSKGRLVCVEGSVEINQYPKQDGTQGVSVDVQCDNIETLEPPREGDGSAPQGGQGGGYQNRQGGQGHQGGQGDGEYFDDGMSAAPAHSQGGQGGGQNASGPAPRGQGGPQGQGAPQRAAAPAGAQSGQSGQGGRGPAPQPAYPQNDYDFDDSDPFADE